MSLVPKRTLRFLAASLALALLGACGGRTEHEGTSNPPPPLARIGADMRSEPFTTSGPWHVAATANGYCAVTVFTEPGGEAITARWSDAGFTIHLDDGGRFSLAASGCTSVEARPD